MANLVLQAAADFQPNASIPHQFPGESYSVSEYRAICISTAGNELSIRYNLTIKLLHDQFHDIALTSRGTPFRI